VPSGLADGVTATLGLGDEDGGSLAGVDEGVAIADAVAVGRIVGVAGTADVVAVATGVDTAASDDDGLAVGATGGGTFTTETFEDCGVPLSPNTTY
jgi:hypothetical protein